MQPREARVLLAGAPTTAVVDEPLAAELPDRHLSEQRVGPVAAHDVGFKDREPLLGVALAVEGLGREAPLSVRAELAGLERPEGSLRIEPMRRDVTELVTLLLGGQWLIMYDARIAGATWTEIGQATRQAGEEAQGVYVAAIKVQERHGITSTSTYRAVI